MPVTLLEIESSRLQDIFKEICGRDEYMRQRLGTAIEAVVRQSRREAKKQTLQEVAEELRSRGSALHSLFTSKANIL